MPGFNDRFDLFVYFAHQVYSQHISSNIQNQFIERNRLKVLQVAQRFEKLIAERRMQEGDKDKTDQELISEIVSRYNSYKANSALKHWQLSPDMESAVVGLIVGMSPAARQEIRSHLDFNKWEQSGLLVVPCFVVSFKPLPGQHQRVVSQIINLVRLYGFSPCQGYNESLLRTRRHQLNESPKGLEPLWQKILTVTCICYLHVFHSFYKCTVCLLTNTLFFHIKILCFAYIMFVSSTEVTPDSQVLAFRRYNFWWQINARKMKPGLRNRLRWNDEAWSRGIDHACLCVWAMNEARMDAKVALLSKGGWKGLFS